MAPAGHNRKEFFWLDKICCPKCRLDLPYLPSWLFALFFAASPRGRPEPKAPALLRSVSQVKGLVKERKMSGTGWFCCLFSKSGLSFLAKNHPKLSQMEDV